MIALDKVRGWINVNVVGLRSERYITDHLSMSTVLTSELLPGLIQTFISFSKALESEYPELGLMVILNPKTCEEENLSLNVPQSLGALIDDLDESSPPAVRVAQPDSKSVCDIAEEYRVSVNFLNSTVIRGVATTGNIETN